MKNPRINLLKKNSKFYKLDFGINETEQSEDFYTLILLAVLAGFKGIDIFANENIIKIANDAIIQAKKKSTELNIEINHDPLLCASFGMSLISNLEKNKIYKKVEFLKEPSIDVIDVHLNEIDFSSNMKKIDLVCDFFKEKIISLNLSRKILSNAHIVDLLEACFIYTSKNIIVEVEGLQFYENNFSHILQTISTADIINKQFLQKSPKYKRVPIIFGDCKNREIEKLALKCNVPFNGLSFNSHEMRNILKNKSFPLSDEEINLSLNKIKSNLIYSN